MEPITIATLASGAGAWFVTMGVLMVLKSQMGPYWTDLANRLTTVILPIVLVEFAIVVTAQTSGDAVPWYLYVLGALNGLLASQGANKTQIGYDAKVLSIAREKAL